MENLNNSFLFYKNKLLIVIVIYNKNINEIQYLKNYVEKDITFFIYDNSPVDQIISSNDGNMIYTHDPKNSGVSRAYNLAALKAKELGKENILILDHDTDFTLDALWQYYEAYTKNSKKYIYAPTITNKSKTKIYSPSILKNYVGKTHSFKSFKFDKEYFLFKKTIINSGMMIPLETFEKIGGYNEKIPLDFSDIYFIEKYKKIYDRIILIDLILKHSISGDDGNNYEKELNRYKYYCLGAKELGKALHTTTWWSPVRRLIRLIIKYRKLNFFIPFFKYYLN